MPILSTDKKELLFIHIPKCGGTFIDEMFLRILPVVRLYNRKNGDFPCTPQHFHRALLDIIFYNQSVPSFAITRHPTLRVLSEYFWEQQFFDGPRGLLDVESRIVGWFDRYSVDNYIRDNHIRPQCELILESTQLCRLEDQYVAALEFAADVLEVHILDGRDEPTNSSATENIHLTKLLIDRINEFYECDFYLLGYRPVKVGDRGIYFDDLKSICRTGFMNGTAKNYDQYESVINENRLRHEFRRRRLEKISGRDVNIYRKEAIEIEKASVNAAALLMTRANELTPGEPFIEGKLEHYHWLTERAAPPGGRHHRCGSQPTAVITEGAVVSSSGAEDPRALSSVASRAPTDPAHVIPPRPRACCRARRANCRRRHWTRVLGGPRSQHGDV